MTDSSVTWNDERVEQLTKLWAEGRSASQIAAEIGGVSRNAVIGKVHRLGLSGRVKAPSAAAARPREKAAPLQKPSAAEASAQSSSTPVGQGFAQSGRSSAQPSGQPSARSSEVVREPAKQPASQPLSFGATALAQPRLVEASPERAAEPAPRPTLVAAVVHIAERVTIMDLRDGMCRWPIGDPTSSEFRFCGASAYTGVPYCEYHSQLAYQPSADRRREKKIVRA